MICLTPSDLRPDLIEFCKEGGIELIECDIGHNQEPFVSMSSEKVYHVLSLCQGDYIFVDLLIRCSTNISFIITFYCAYIYNRFYQ